MQRRDAVVKHKRDKAWHRQKLQSKNYLKAVRILGTKDTVGIRK